jgi:hypothetical protein
MRRYAITVVACLTLAACAARAWTKPGTTQADYNKDSYSCERDIQQALHLGGWLAGTLNARDMYARCMQAAGWTEAQHGQGFETTTPP